LNIFLKAIVPIEETEDGAHTSRS